MKIICEIPNGPFKITIYSWNNKYILKYEAEAFEQTYKVSQMDVPGEEEIKQLALDTEFVKRVGERFNEMAKDFFYQLDQIN
ncbi:MAG: hypothetical protein K2Q22_16800 [Cytophagales bacterium]|nr:hypothetical protein [Cytophagales bacterium]